VVDDRALVLTENWTPGGVGGRDNRGWGVRVADDAVAGDLAGLFDADWAAARPWRAARGSLSTRARPAAEGSYPGRTAPRSLRAERVAVLTAPGNAGDGVVALVDDAEERVDLIGPSADPDGRVVGALVAAARRGVRVRVLLGSAWYAREENRAVVERLRAVAEREGLPLSARLADPGGRYGSVHAKGLVVDDTAVVGSLNWNDHAATENREVALALHGDAVAAYYRAAFRADWRGGRAGLSPWLVVAALLAGAVAVAVLRRRVSWGDGGDASRPDERGPRPPGGDGGRSDRPGPTADHHHLSRDVSTREGMRGKQRDGR
jgi:phosphatidylserine/phosphatidylglycerophosphate/cardiolipin synthase-like enzyme